VILGDGIPVALDGDLSLGLRQNYTIVEWEGARGPWKVKTFAYSYVLLTGEDELLAFHWHPRGPSPVTTPHLHVGRGADPATRSCSAPTSRPAASPSSRC
jgi:hypothetical protein